MRQRLSRRRRFELAGHAVIVVATWWSVSAPNGYFAPVMVMAVVWLALGVYTLGAYVVRAIAGRSFRPRFFQLASAIAFVAMCAVALLDGPILVRALLSRGAMQQVVRDAHRDPASIEHRHRIGLYRVEQVAAYRGGVRFIVADTGFLDHGGFAYSSAGEPPVIGEDSYEHLYGGWYTWNQSW